MFKIILTTAGISYQFQPSKGKVSDDDHFPWINPSTGEPDYFSSKKPERCEVPAAEPIKTWHGEADVATYKFIGGFRPDFLKCSKLQRKIDENY